MRAGLAIVLLLWGVAVVRGAASSFTVNATDDAGDVLPGDGVCASAAASCTLRAAIEEASAGSGASVELPAGHYALATALDVAAPVTIHGAGRDATILDAADATRAFDVHGTSLALQGLTIQHGGATQEGGAIRAYDATLTLDTVAISTSAADGNGGALFAAGSTVTISGSTFDQDTALDGGAVFVFGGDLAITGSTFTNCLAFDAGGAVAAFAPHAFSVAASTFSDDTAEHPGGAIDISGAVGTATFTVDGSTFSNDVSFGDSGGAIATDGLVGGGGNGTLAVTNSTFTENSADQSGGAIASGAAVRSTGNTFTDNQAGDSPDVAQPAPFDFCADPSSCDDGDACTVDACASNACSHTPKADLDAVGCRVDAIDAALAGATPADLAAPWKKKLQGLAHKLRTKLALAVEAEQSGKARKQKKTRQSALTAAKAMQKAVAKGVKAHKVGAALGATLQALVGDGIAALTPPTS